MPFCTVRLCVEKQPPLLDNRSPNIYNKHTLHQRSGDYADCIHYIMGVALRLLLLRGAQDEPCTIYIGRFFPFYVRMVSRKLFSAVRPVCGNVRHHLPLYRRRIPRFCAHNLLPLEEKRQQSVTQIPFISTIYCG